jgi:CBS domain-containing protein
MQVSELIEKRGCELYSIGPDKTVAEMIEALNERHVGALVVVGPNDQLLGIVSERVVLRAAYDAGRKSVDCSKKVRDVMRKRDEMPTVTMTTRLNEVLELMSSARTRHIVVVDEQDHAVTCVSVRDIIERMLADAESENRELQNFMYGY